MSLTTSLVARQIWAGPTPTSQDIPHTCLPFRLPGNGVLNLGGGTILTLASDAIFQPACTMVDVALPGDPLLETASVSVVGDEAPFYASTDPQIYATAAVTISSYMLVLILFVTPRTFYIGGSGGGNSLFGQSGQASGLFAGNQVIGIGSRPWLQKLAALTLATSLTIVSVDTFMWAERQYDAGYQDAAELAGEVQNSLEVKIVMLISELFLWLAQAQTLIRLFQRHREKLVIKWSAFVLITLEIIFSILNHFIQQGSSAHQPRAFESSIPALNYLFSLSLNICYASFVLVYAFRKRRFAYWHQQMHSMPLMALLSHTAILVPIAFFILDLSKPDVSGWGNYVRWVSSCAASVVVWEWVERIEAVEREEKKGGILGREVFDGDEMLTGNSAKDETGQAKSRRRRNRRHHKPRNVGFTNGVSQLAQRLGRSEDPEKGKSNSTSIDSSFSASEPPGTRGTSGNLIRFALPPRQVQSPVNRGDSASAASTVYMVRYHPPTQPTPPIFEASKDEEAAAEADVYRQYSRGITVPGSVSTPTQEGESPPLSSHDVRETTKPAWPSRLARIPHPFRHRRQSPPAEVAAAIANINPLAINSTMPPPIDDPGYTSSATGGHDTSTDFHKEAQPRPSITTQFTAAASALTDSQQDFPSDITPRVSHSQVSNTSTGTFLSRLHPFRRRNDQQHQSPAGIIYVPSRPRRRATVTSIIPESEDPEAETNSSSTTMTNLEPSSQHRGDSVSHPDAHIDDKTANEPKATSPPAPP